MIGDDPRFTHHGHERRIAIPAGDEMEMQVVADARSGGFAEVEAYIDALRFEKLPENGRALLEQFHDFRRFLRRQKRQIHDVPQGSHHDMPVVVRKFVHDDESGLATVQDEPFLVMGKIIGRETQNARIRFRPQNIVHTPRGPQRMCHTTASLS